MKKYLLFLMTVFFIQDAVCALSGPLRIFYRVGVRSMTTFSDFQKEYPTSTGILIGLGVSVAAGVGANELHQRTLGKESSKQILALQNQILENQNRFESDMSTMKNQLGDLQRTLDDKKKEEERHILLVRKLEEIDHRLAIIDRTGLVFGVATMASTKCSHYNSTDGR